MCGCVRGGWTVVRAYLQYIVCGHTHDRRGRFSRAYALAQLCDCEPGGWRMRIYLE